MDFCDGDRDGAFDNDIDGEFSIYKSGSGESGEKFENGIRLHVMWEFVSRKENAKAQREISLCAFFASLRETNFIT